jgi:cytidylate kinase
MPTSIRYLPSSVEQRLEAWQKIQFRNSRKAVGKSRPTLTISRGFGCEAFPLAECLKGKLDEISKESWTIFDRALIQKVFEERGISLFLLNELGDPPSDLDYLGLNSIGHITHREAFEVVSQYIREIAVAGNAILIGRGSPVLCGSLGNCYHFRLEASMQWRIASLAKRKGMSEEDARDLIRTSGRHREHFLNVCLDANVSDLLHYDAVFNNERHSVEQMAAGIVAYLRQDWPDQTYFRTPLKQASGT